MTIESSTTHSTSELLAAGYSATELSRLTRRGSLVQLRRGAYVWGSGSDLSPVERHRRLVLATAPMLAPDAVVSHLSAGILHGLPVWQDQLAHVQVTRSTVTSGKRRGPLHLYAAPLPADEVVKVDGVALTSLARTVVDLGRSLSFERAVITGDAAAGLIPDAELTACLETSRGRPGIAAARRAVAFLDSRSESPGESLSRAVLHRHGVPAPVLQHDVRDRGGRVVGRADFAWLEQRTLGEFDGRVKYGRLLHPGQSASDAVYAEKRREDALRDLGWQVVRWSWADLQDPQVIVERLLRAFSRGLH